MGELRSETLTGSIRIGIPDEYGGTVLPGVIAEFSRCHPHAEIAVRCSFSAGFPEALKSNELDLAVYAVETPDKKTMTLLRKEKTHWVTSKHHSVHEQNPVPVALFDRDCWWRNRALEVLEESKKHYRVVYTSESVSGVAASISAGVAVGLLSERSLHRGLQVLMPAQGFPQMPVSSLVLESRSDIKSPLLNAMTSVIKHAFT